MYSGGSGTALDPYLIATAQDLYDIRSNLGSYFKLIKDIDLAGTLYETFDKIGSFSGSPFTGEIDGDGKIVSNIIHNITGSYDGFIAFADGATIKNLGFADVNTETATNTDYAGVIIGDMKNGTSLTGCFSTGKFKVGTTSSNYTGGLVGQSETATDSIENCFTDLDLEAYRYVGGILGFSVSAMTINKCYAAGNVRCDNQAGGIAYNTTISNCAAVMDSISRFGSQTTFARVGFGTTTNNYANSAMAFPLTPTSDANGKDGLDKTLTELKQRSTYESGLGWDFTDTWVIDEGNFPTLKAFESGINAIFFGTNF